MTGYEFSKYWQQLIDKAYSGYYDTTKQNRLFKEALINITQEKQNSASTQQYFDELNSLTLTEQSFTLSNDSDLTIASIPDYMHMKTFKMKTKIFIAEVDSCEGNVVIFKEGMNINQGENVYFENVIPLSSNLNGFYYCKPISKTKVRVYVDSNLSTPLNINPQYSANGTAYYYRYQYGRVLLSDEKISVYAKPDARFPKVEFSENKLKFYPKMPLGEVVIDYYKTPTVMVDANDNIINLEDTYSLKFLYYWAEKAAVRFKQIVQDGEGVQLQQMTIIENP